MRNDPLKITRLSADKLTLETWGFQVTFPASHTLRSGEGVVVVCLSSYEHATRASLKHRKFTPTLRLVFGAHYPSPGAARRSDWLDVTTSDYAWGCGDFRSAGPATDKRPPLPVDVEADAYNALRPRVTIAQPDT